MVEPRRVQFLYMAPRTAFITGIGGQDGSYLAELLLAAGYRVVGAVRPGWNDHAGNLAQVRHSIEVVELQLESSIAVDEVVAAVKPSAVFHLAADSFVADLGGSGVDAVVAMADNLFTAVRRGAPEAVVVNAASAEIFGDAASAPQSEMTPVAPCTPYGEAKALVFERVQQLRNSGHLRASSAILFNHESPRRPERFVSMKVARAAAAIAAGQQDELELGSLESRRDWSHAMDSVHAMKLMAESWNAEDFVIASGISHSVGDVVEVAFAAMGLDWRRHVRLSAQFARPAESVERRGDSTLIRKALGWMPTISFNEMIVEMVVSEQARLAQ